MDTLIVVFNFYLVSGLFGLIVAVGLRFTENRPMSLDLFDSRKVITMVRRGDGNREDRNNDRKKAA